MADGELFVGGWCIHTSTPTSCHMEWREQSDLSSDVAAIFTHGGSCCSNTWFYCDNIMVFQGQCSHWNEILCVKKKRKKEILRKRRQHRQRRMWIQSCLSRPLRPMWLFFNAFTPAPFLSICSAWTKGLLVFTLPSPPPLPCLITSYSTQTHADSSALFPLSPPLAYVPPSPLFSVSPSFLVAVSLW